MSAASATETAPADGAAPAKGSKKKLIIIIAAVVVVLLLVAGGGVFYMMQQKAAAQAAALAEEGDETAADEHKADAHSKAKKPERPEHPPIFVPLDPFVVNLADKESDRFAQVGLNFQVDEAPVADEIKSYMPAIRNAILLILAHKTSADLLSPEGKNQLASEIKWGATRAMGYEVPAPDQEQADTSASDEAEEEVEPPKKKRKKKKKADPYSPIVQVNYATLVVQ
jgi:flagellar protein FliL